MISDGVWAKLFGLGTRSDRIRRARSSIPSSQDGCRGPRSLLCAALEDFELSPTENVIAVRLLLGESILLIASCTGKKVSTVKTHISAIYRKVHASDRAEFAAEVLKRVLWLADKSERRGP